MPKTLGDGLNECLDLISIVVSAYNAIEWIDDCVQSVLSQTSDKWQLIIVDDGSTDGTREHLERYRSEKIKVLLREHAGLSAGRNAAMSLVDGGYLAFLDADDRLRSDYVERVLGIMESNQLDLLYFGSSVFSEDSAMKERVEELARYCNRPFSKTHGVEGKGLFVELSRMDRFVLTGCLQVVRSDLLERAHSLSSGGLLFEPGFLFEDNPYTLRNIIYAHAAGIISDELYIRRVHPHSITNASHGRELLEYKSYLFNRSILRKLVLDCEHDSNVVRELAGFDQWYTELLISLADKIGTDCPGTEAPGDSVSLDNEYALALDKALRIVTERLDRVEGDCCAIANSTSFRLGRALTFPLRFLRNRVFHHETVY